MRRRWMVLVGPAGLLVILAALLVMRSAPTESVAPSPHYVVAHTPTVAQTAAVAYTAPPAHVMLILMENHSYSDIIGNPDAPYLNSLASRYRLATASYATTHPSLPNYLELMSGSTQGITTDCATCTADGTQLVDQLQAAGIGWKGYMESMPSPCYTGNGYYP